MYILFSKASIQKISPVTRKLEDYPIPTACGVGNKCKARHPPLSFTLCFSDLPAKPSAVFVFLLVLWSGHIVKRFGIFVTLVKLT